MSSLTWYELLGVDRDASPAEIKAAWRDATDKFEPGSGNRQFSLFNEAADVLLDPEKRAAYDAELAGEEGPAEEPSAEEPAAEDPPAEEASAEAPVEAETPESLEESPAEQATESPSEDATEISPDEESSATPKRTFPGSRLAGAAARGLTSTLGLGILAVVAVASVVLASVLFVRADLGEQADVANARVAAQSVAEKGLAVALSYNYQRLDQDRDNAISYMTPAFAEKFRKPFDAISTGKDNSPSTAVARKTVVVSTVQAAGVIDAAPDRVRLLVYVDQSVTNIDGGPVVFENRVIVTMVRTGGKWLIDGLETLGRDCPLCAPTTPGATGSATPAP